jgi:hypothetical protein
VRLDLLAPDNYHSSLRMTPTLAAENIAASETPRLTVSWKDGVWLAASLFLAAVQLSQGTDPLFTALVLAFILIWLVTIRICGGMMTLSGAVVGYLGFQHIVFSQFAKALYWQRPDTPLYDAVFTMQIYCVGMLGIFAAALVTNLPAFRRLQPILRAEIPTDRLKVMAYICTALMILRYAGSPQLGVGGIRFLMNFEFIMPLAAAINAAWVVQESEGKKFFNWLSMINIGIPLLVAMIGHQRRESIFAAVIMVITAICYGFRFRLKHYMLALALIYFFQFIFFPFALYYRNMPGKSRDLAANFANSWEALTTVMANPMEFQDESKFTPAPAEWETKRLLYYDLTPNPTADRFSVIIVTDALLHAAEREPPLGWQTINAGIDMWIPRVFNDDKAILGTSNVIAQRAPGLVNEIDFGTQITMGFFAEAYLSFRWTGVFFIGFIAFGIAFLVIRFTVADSLKNSFWTASFALGVPWVCAEGTVQQLIILFGQTFPVFAALGFTIMILGNSLARGPNRQRELVEEGEVFQSSDLRLAG